MNVKKLTEQYFEKIEIPLEERAQTALLEEGMKGFAAFVLQQVAERLKGLQQHDEDGMCEPWVDIDDLSALISELENPGQ